MPWNAPFPCSYSLLNFSDLLASGRAWDRAVDCKDDREALDRAENRELFEFEDCLEDLENLEDKAIDRTFELDCLEHLEDGVVEAIW